MKDNVNEIQISYREKIGTLKSSAMNNSEDVAKLLFKNWDKGTMVDLRILFAIVLKTLSVGIILTHNHPSGKLMPSEADKSLTKKIKKAAQFFDVVVLDHLIIAPDGDYYSFANNGLL